MEPIQVFRWREILRFVYWVAGEVGKGKSHRFTDLPTLGRFGQLLVLAKILPLMMY